jgi:hypothetical protein
MSTTSYPCPICGARVTAKVYHDWHNGESFLSESYASCPANHWSLTFADGLSTEVVTPAVWAWTTTESRAEFERREAEIHEAIAAHPDYAIGVVA